MQKSVGGVEAANWRCRNFNPMSGTIIGIHVYIRQDKHNSTLQRQTTAQHNNQNRSKFMQEGQLVCSHPGVLVRQELGPELNAGPKKKPVGTHLV